MHQSSLDKMVRFRDTYLSGRESEQLNILDLGSMNVNGTYRDILASPNWSYTGLDMVAGNGVDIVLKDPYRWREVRSNSVDIVVSGQAFEHVEYFWVTFLEMIRVAKPDGLICIIAPASGPEHRYPQDCWRFYPDSFHALSKYGGVKLEEVTTQWESLNYEDKSDQWQDTMAVCRKPNFNGFLKMKSDFRRFLIHRASLIGCS